MSERGKTKKTKRGKKDAFTPRMIGMPGGVALDAIHEPALEVTRAMASLHTTNAAASADLQLHEITRFLMLKIPMIHEEI